jgi:hypothetical protein
MGADKELASSGLEDDESPGLPCQRENPGFRAVQSNLVSTLKDNVGQESPGNRF